MKVLHFIDEIKMGGAQTHLLTIVKEMLIQHPNDIQKVVVLFEDDSLSDKFREIGVEVECLDLRNYFATKSYFKIISILKKYIKNENPNVVETHLTWSRLLANTAAKLVGIKNRIGFEQGDIYLNSIFFRITNFFSQFIFDKIIVCSDELKSWTNKTHYIANSKLKVMYNCVDLVKFKPVETKNLENILEKKLPKFNFISVGTLGKGVNKRVDISIKATAILSEKGYDIGLIVCGDGEQKQELEKLALDLGIETRVQFLGMRNDIPKILPHAFAFVHAAPYEPFGIVCIEAMASGLPAIVPNSGGIQKIVSDGEDGYIYEHLNENQLAIKMETLLLNDSYSKMVESTIEKVKKYDVKLYVEELYKLYHA